MFCCAVRSTADEVRYHILKRSKMRPVFHNERVLLVVPKKWNLPFILKLPDCVLRREVQINLGGGQAVMAKEGHEGPGGDPLFDAVDLKGMAKDMGGDGLGDPGFVGHFFDDPLNGPAVMPVPSCSAKW